MKKKLNAILAVSCAIISWGTVSSVELDRMELSTAIIIGIITLPLFIIGVKNLVGGYYNE